MKRIYALRASIVTKARALNAQAEAAAGSDAALAESAAQIYVGDIYSLREDMHPCKDNGWGRRRYSGSDRAPAL